MRARYYANRPDELEKRKEYRRKNPEKIKGQQLRIKYGLTLAAYHDMHVAQDHKCACCAASTKLHVDHDHDTGAVRSLLCSPCNSALGLLGDSSSRAAQAVAYLQRHGK